MRIGILTYHAACNFGANLQALSTYSYLKNQGHTPLVIDWMTQELENYYRRSIPLPQYLAHQRFRQEKLVMTKPCYTDDDIVKVIKDENIEAIIVGSDAVMQHHSYISRVVFPSRHIISVSKIGQDRMCPNPFWGSFLHLLQKRIPIAFMSASSQNSAYRSMTNKERTTAASLLSNYTYISTRDDWTANMVYWITHGRIMPEVTPDPVFAFNYNVKEQLSEEYIRTKFNIKGRYYLLSFHDSKTVSMRWLSEFQEIASESNIECIAMAFPNGIKYKHPFKHTIDIPLSPMEWFALIRYSDGYIGHNMHPIVVSLHNAVPCFSFDNYGVVRLKIFVNEKSSKIYHIMKSFRLLENRASCVGKLFKRPTPQYVIERLNSFDRGEVKKIANKYLEEYKLMMQNIIGSFN